MKPYKLFADHMHAQKNAYGTKKFKIPPTVGKKKPLGRYIPPQKKNPPSCGGAVVQSVRYLLHVHAVPSSIPVLSVLCMLISQMQMIVILTVF